MRLLIDFNFIILILGGISAASWLVVRFIGLAEEDILKVVDSLALIGFPIGVISFFTIGAGFYIYSTSIELLPTTYDWFTVTCLGIQGLVLILRPIKDFKFGAILSLGVGLLGAALLIYLGAENVKMLSAVFVILFLAIYGAIKVVEDLYLIIAEILASPVISVTIGIICIAQGILEFVGLSVLMLLPF